MKTITPQLLSKIRPFKAIDATMVPPGAKGDARGDYLKARLPGAQFFDMEEVKAPSPYPHMMPSKEVFEATMSRFGINQGDTVLVYDQLNMFSSPRMHWMLKMFGHERVYVLDNFSDYAASHELERGPPAAVEPSEYRSRGVGRWIEFEEMERVAKDPGYEVLDARSFGRFSGAEPEPRAGLSNGHIPGAKSLPAMSVLRDGHYKPQEEIRAMLEERGVDLSKQVVCTCGSGVTACIIKYAIDPLLEKPALVYDGSWTEWAQRSTSIEGASASA